jgi:hypothetical protein
MRSVSQKLRDLIKDGVRYQETMRVVDVKLQSDAANLLEALDYLVKSLYEEKIKNENI